MSKKVRIDLSMRVKRKHASLTITMKPLDVELEPSLEPVAKAMATNVRAAIDAQPGNKWDKSGVLRAGIEAGNHSVTVPPDRLQTPELRKAFAEDVVAQASFQAPNVGTAIGEVLDNVLDARKGGR